MGGSCGRRNRPTVGLVSVQRLHRQQQVLVLQVLHLGQQRLQRGQLLAGPAHPQEVDVVAALSVVLVALLKLYRKRDGEGCRKRGGKGTKEEKRRCFCCMTFTKTWRAGGDGISRSPIDSSLEVLKGILTAWGGRDREGAGHKEKRQVLLESAL